MNIRLFVIDAFRTSNALNKIAKNFTGDEKFHGGRFEKEIHYSFYDCGGSYSV